MSQTFVFEELDSVTRDYLTAVRDAEGDGAPGMFVPTSSAMVGCGAFSGIGIIVFTLVATLTPWPADIVYHEPGAVALLQTAGLMLGGWLLLAAVRSAGSSKGSKTHAGHWVYVDALHLYEAYRETVTVTPIDEVVEANHTHTYNQGNYQHSVVRILLGGGMTRALTLKNEGKAEQLVTFLNYLAWARGPEGGERTGFSAAKLGALARYVADHDVEPKDHEDNLDMDLVNLEIDEVAKEPTREGRAAPPIFPYIVIVAAGVGIFFLMWKVVNPPIRDDAMFEAVTDPDWVREPLPLRAYLIDERNTRHRAEVQRMLEGFYTTAISNVTRAGQDPNLRDGMAKILDSVKGPEQPTVSLTVKEKNGRGDPAARVKKLRDDLVGSVEKKEQPGVPTVMVNHGGIIGELAKAMPAISPPTADIKLTEPPWPRGAQLIDFADKPEDAEHAHFEITYEFVPIGKTDSYSLDVTVEIRTDLNGAPVATYKEHLSGQFPERDFDKQLGELKDRLVKGMVGNWQPVAGFGG